jgi:hypothetical protein
VQTDCTAFYYLHYGTLQGADMIEVEDELTQRSAARARMAEYEQSLQEERSLGEQSDRYGNSNGSVTGGGSSVAASAALRMTRGPARAVAASTQAAMPKLAVKEIQVKQVNTLTHLQQQQTLHF